LFLFNLFIWFCGFVMIYASTRLADSIRLFFLPRTIPCTSDITGSQLLISHLPPCMPLM
jgi:hypothetical protein